MRDVTGGATLNLHRFMLENERSLLVGVAGVADSVLGRRRPYLLGPDCAVHVMTIGALNQTFVHAMVKGHLKLGFLLQMAGIAKRGLLFYEKEVLRLRMVRRVAGDATNIVLTVRGIDSTHVLSAARVACQTASVDFFRRSIFEDKNLCFVAAAGDMIGARPVTPFATLLGGAAFLILCGLPMRRFLPGIVNFFVAGLAGFRSYIFWDFGGSSTDRGLDGVLGVLVNDFLSSLR